MNDKLYFPLTNYHSHTVRCMHAYGTEESFVRQAIQSGFSVMGFSDHTPWPYKNGYISGMRMPVSQLDEYIQVVRGLGEKYKDQISVPLGLECESFPEYFGWLSDLKDEKLDYLILGNHFDTDDSTGGEYFGHARTPASVTKYVKNTIRAMQTGLFAYVAHPDLFARSYPKIDADFKAASRGLCEAAKSLNIPLEYNLLGLLYRDIDTKRGGQGYPCETFWEIAAETGCTAIIGMDAHQVEQIEDIQAYMKGRNTLKELGMKVETKIPMKIG